MPVSNLIASLRDECISDIDKARMILDKISRNIFTRHLSTDCGMSQADATTLLTELKEFDPFNKQFSQKDATIQQKIDVLGNPVNDLAVDKYFKWPRGW
jgi:hypothetical protein